MSVVLLKQEVDSPVTSGEADGNFCGLGEVLEHPRGGIPGQAALRWSWGRRGFPVACQEMNYS